LRGEVGSHRRCDPGEGDSQRAGLAERAPHPASPSSFAGASPTLQERASLVSTPQGRGEGARPHCRDVEAQSIHLHSRQFQTHLRASRRGAPEWLQESYARKGRGECRVPDAPAASCAEGVGSVRTSIHSESPEQPGIPARNGFTAYNALSPVTNSFCHRRRRIKALSNPVELAKPPPT
jgi:hypothetical protein